VPKNPRKQAGRRKSPSYLKALKWIAAVGVVALIVYGASQMSGVAYGEDAIRVVSFSELRTDDKRSALKKANQARCNCGCGMTLAQCVATDSTCPVRESNIDRIKTIVREAARP
jgi:hypothetical protein